MKRFFILFYFSTFVLFSKEIFIIFHKSSIFFLFAKRKRKNLIAFSPREKWVRITHIIRDDSDRQGKWKERNKQSGTPVPTKDYGGGLI